MVAVFEITTKKLLTTYPINTDIQTIEHDIDVNGYKFISMLKVKDVFEITVIKK